MPSVGSGQGRVDSRSRPRTSCSALPPPELLVAKVHEKFDDGLRLKDEGTRKLLGDLLVRFSQWIGRERVAAEAKRELLGA